MRKALVYVLAAVLSLTLASCGKTGGGQPAASPGVSPGASQPAQASGKLADIRKAGKIVLGTSAEYAPYEFHKNVGGKDQIVGFDINIARQIAQDLGVTLEIKDMDFGSLLTELKLGTIDFVIAGMTPDATRRKAVDFTRNYYEAAQAVLVRAEEKDKFAAMKDLEGRTIGAQIGSTQEKIAKGIPGAKVKSLGKTTELVLELKAKKADAVIVEKPVAQGYANKNADLAIAAVTPQYEAGGSAVAVNKGESGLLAEIQKSLDRMKTEGKIDRWVAEMTDLAEK